MDMPDYLAGEAEQVALENKVFEVKINEKKHGDQNTGTITMHVGNAAHTYTFVTGGCGRGAAPFGHYEIGAFRSHDDDPLNIGPRWMIKQVGLDDGEANDPRYKTKRFDLELHMMHPGHVRCTLGCIGIDGGMPVWREFMDNLNTLIASVGTVHFTLAGNPQGTDVLDGALGVYDPPKRRWAKHKPVRKAAPKHHQNKHKHGRRR